ncbi:MAG: phage major capsid protein [Oscillospiraceae bacterium]|jgi:hypothetical protein|nr:phage major capsid protein [Oscillospiraceae bacterium]
MAIYENITLEKGMYGQKGKSLTEVLEALDPTENYSGTALGKLDAFSRQLKRFNIRVSGPGSDCVEKFFQNSNSSALFPEYVSRAVQQGMNSVDILPNIVATVTNIDGMDYRTVTSEPINDGNAFPEVAQSGEITSTAITTQANLVAMRKRGKMITSSYEALRFQRIDLFTVILKQIGAYIARAQLADAVDVLVSGDGNNNAAEVINAAGGVTYADLLNLWEALDPYSVNTLVAPVGMVKEVLNLAQMNDAVAGLNFAGTGNMVTPMGAKLLACAAVPEGKIIGLDKTCALEMVQSGGVITDYDKLIDRQLERATVSCITGFAKIFAGAAKVLNTEIV